MRVDLHADGAELVERAFGLGDRGVDVVERDSGAESLEAVGVVRDDLRHAIVGDRASSAVRLTGPRSSSGGAAVLMICR